MRQGQTVNVALNPLGAKQLLPDETFVPAHLELRNGVRTDGGNYTLRPGSTPLWTLPGSQPIMLLIPEKRDPLSRGFAVTEDGRVVELRRDGSTVVYLGPTLNGIFRPTWCKFDDIPIICDGQAPIKINPVGSTTSLLGGNPPAAKFCAVVADRVVLSGYDATGFRWSSPGSAELWPIQNESNVTGHGEEIRYMQVAQTELYFFKTTSVEVWSHIGGNEVFGRRGIVTIMDKFTRNRGISGFSVVMGPGSFFFYADGDFWTLSGMTAQPISAAYRREIGSLEVTDFMYGFHFSKEHLIRWFVPDMGRCFVYDYVNQVFTEDNAWLHGDWGRMRIQAHMELDGVAYVGDYEPTGIVSRWDTTTTQDAGQPIRLQRLVRIGLDEKGHRARVNQLRVRVSRGKGRPTLSTTNLWPNGAVWTAYNGGTATTTTTEVYEGTSALLLTSAPVQVGGNCGGAFAVNMPVLTVNRQYRLQFFSKALVGLPTVRASVQNGQDDQNSLSFNFSPTTTWTQFGQTASLTFNASILYFWSVATVNAAWVIDQVEIFDVTNLYRETPRLLVRWSFDEGDWTPYVSADLGAVGERDPYVDIPHPSGTACLGSGRELRLELVQHEDVTHLLTHANLTVKKLGR
jgi:hypothetical protein